ncbi:hypothetical protein T03_5330 [Trichinella britovi]|uniref:Uncharacterized protein n=1 Tax=Trichinella britovi TaxID=45882 RepID=A0A0V1DG55_TRIBR|nr:hypothetical protein T03_5330 [Trichinella britovi]
MTTSCRIRPELKPRQRLNVDFKGPLPSVSSNRYVLTVCEVTSRTTAYKSSRKGTRKGYHGVIWKAIILAQWFQQLPIEQWEEAFDLTITLDTFINVGSNQHNSPSLGIPHFSCSLFSEEHRRVHSSQSGKFTRPKCTQQIQTEKSMEYAMPIRGQICLQWRSLKERKLKEKITSGMLRQHAYDGTVSPWHKILLYFSPLIKLRNENINALINCGDLLKIIPIERKADIIKSEKSVQEFQIDTTMDVLWNEDVKNKNFVKIFMTLQIGLLELDDFRTTHVCIGKTLFNRVLYINTFFEEINILDRNDNYNLKLLAKEREDKINE